MNKKRGKLEGSVIFVQPMSLPIFTLFSISFCILVILGVFFLEFTGRTTVKGTLVPEGGIVKVYSPSPGIVTQKHFTDGSTVYEGQVLYTMGGNRHTVQTADVERTLLEHAQSRIDSSRMELSNIRNLESNEKLIRDRKIKLLQKQMVTIETQMRLQESQINLAGNIYNRYTGLVEKGYITNDHLSERESALIEQKNRLSSLERERAALTAELLALEGENASAHMRYAMQYEQAERNLSMAKHESVELDSKREYLIKAPIRGLITGVQIEVGEAVDGTRPLLTILPENRKLIAELYVPRSAIGFIGKNTVVSMQYEAYKYQKYGLHKGKIISISEVTIPSQELAIGSGGVPRENNQVPAESYYRVAVELSSDQVRANGKVYHLKPGIVVSAELDLETKKIYQWLFDPIVSANGRFVSILK